MKRSEKAAAMSIIDTLLLFKPPYDYFKVYLNLTTVLQDNGLASALKATPTQLKSNSLQVYIFSQKVAKMVSDYFDIEYEELVYLMRTIKEMSLNQQLKSQEKQIKSLEEELKFTEFELKNWTQINWKDLLTPRYGGQTWPEVKHKAVTLRNVPCFFLEQFLTYIAPLQIASQIADFPRSFKPIRTKHEFNVYMDAELKRQNRI